VNGVTDEEALADSVGEAVVAAAVVAAAEEVDVVNVGPAAADVLELAASVVLVAAGVLEEAGVLEAGAAAEEALLDPPAGGRLMGTPACWQVDTTAAWTLAWSAAEQALATQGVMVEISWGFEQWHLKSVRPAQPSVVKAVVKQGRAQLGMSGRDWALVATAAARASSAYVNCISAKR